MDQNCFFFIGSVLAFQLKANGCVWTNCHVFVYTLMRDASLKQRIPCIMHISIFGAFSVGKKCTLYTSKYGISTTATNY